MPTMKVTPDAAMRARDVSRPRDEHLGWAEEAAASVSAATDALLEADVAVTSADPDIPDPEYPGSEERPADPGRADAARRRRVRGVRSASRRGRPAR